MTAKDRFRIVVTIGVFILGGLIINHTFVLLTVVIECVATSLPASYEAELVEDILALMASFSGEIYGQRSAQRRKKIHGKAIDTDDRSKN